MTALVPQALWPLRIRSGDNPESVRLRKYLTGTHLLVDGVEFAVGPSPRRLVWSRDKTRLYRYESTAGVRHAVPVLLVYALILRPYILDLVPGRSLVEFLLGQGFDVYLLDWGVPDADDRGVGIDDYVLDVLPEAVEQVLTCSSADRVTLVGHCQGGTMSAIYAALFPSRSVRNLVLLAAPVDFSPPQPGLLGAWTWLTRQRAVVPSLLAEAAGEAPAALPAVAVRAATRA
ncbi:MAG: alpha/beta fold hydrolase, partial [Actinomycetota bacterium]|nr:alpha/beta fold hydrolase [Actinomycetota bacterium]